MKARRIQANRRRWHLVLVAVAAAIAMAGCAQPYNPGIDAAADSGAGSGGSNSQSTDSGTAAAPEHRPAVVITAIPPIGLSRSGQAGATGVTPSGFTVVAVELTASRDGYDDVVSTLAFDPDSGAWTGTAADLADGEWLFTVRALDDSTTPVVLFSGSATYTVVSGTTNELTIEMKEEIGVARVDATWSVAGAIDTLEVIARRDNFADVISSVSVPLGADSVSTYSLDLAVGGWSLDVVGHTDGVETFRSDGNAVSISNGEVATAAVSVAQTRVTPLTASPDPAVQYGTSFDVTIDTDTPSASVTYTTDGTDPSSSGTASAATAPVVISISTTTTVRAIGSASGLVDSPEIILEYDLSGGAMVEVASWDADMSALIKDDGGLWVWGYNGNGELGLGDTDHRVSPVRLGSETWIDVGVGDFHMAAVRSDGTLWTWGLNGSGQLGNGTNTDSTTPVQEAQGFTNWTAVAVGNSHNLALRSDGTLWAWGWNNYGQLGTGQTTDRTIPTQVGTDDDWVDVAAGYHFSFARKSDGTLYAWGRNHKSQLGLGDATDRTSPTQVGAGSDWVFITAGYEMAGGIRNESGGYTLWTWGSQQSYRLGNGVNDSYNTVDTPTQIITSVTDWEELALARYHGFAITSGGAAYVWGDRYYGRLGTGNEEDVATPVQLGSDTDWKSIASSRDYNLALKDDGRVLAWGHNNNGQLGDGFGRTSSRAEPHQIGTATDWTTIKADGDFVIAQNGDGYLYTWGSNFGGQLGQGTTGGDTNIPVQIGTDSDWSFYELGEDHAVALKPDGTMYTWGEGSYGRLGSQSTADVSTPAAVTFPSNATWTTVSAGKQHTLAIRMDGAYAGTLWATGYNGYSQLGDGTTSSSSIFKQIGSDSDWSAVSAGELQSLALKSDGTLWVWGNDGQTTYQTPTQVGTDTDWVEIDAGDSAQFARKSDGSLWAWGSGSGGSLGLGPNLTQATAPRRIGLDADWQSLWTPSYGSHTVALKNDRLVMWGSSYEFSNEPVPFVADQEPQWDHLGAGNDFTVGLRTDGTIWAWGVNDEGQIAVPRWNDYYDDQPYQDEPVVIIE